MPLLVLAYPAISQKDRDWVQSVRAEYDELYYQIVAPHFSIVFPVFDVDQEIFISHIRQQVQGFQAFQFVLRCASLDKDSFNEYTHVYLVPDEGYSNIVKLHDRLYKGPLASDLRLDIPYIPHIGVANAIDPQICKRLADELNIQNFEVTGKVETLDIVWYENDQVETVEQIMLS